MLENIDANPTKDFFISILVRDINLKDAIGDLVDNCIDGAKRLRGENNYNGLEIKIIANANEFSISDNCGGIDLEIAKKYAFRFGRPEDMDHTNFSIGQFGIGMKRALFKLGKKFSVTSKTTDNHFSMEVDVNKWKSKEDWTFQFTENGEFEEEIEESKTGTSIIVNNLHTDSISAFDDPTFIQELHSDLELDQLYNINKGIRILFNGNPLKSKKLNLSVSDDFEIGHWEKSYDNDEVSVKLIVGIGPQDEQAGGWYIFCNKRLIVGPDTSRMTGWTGRQGDGVANYHHQYRRFRGFAFFEAKDSSKLPWNTTKTGMNLDSAIYKDVRANMIEMMKTVINGFLNYLKRENDSDYGGEQVLHDALSKTEIVNLTNEQKLHTYYAGDRSFTYPVPDKSKNKIPSGETQIRYKVEKEKADKLKKFFGVRNNPELGISSFNYVYDNEIEE